jgi:hypothetical protein
VGERKVRGIMMGKNTGGRKEGDKNMKAIK